MHREGERVEIEDMHGFCEDNAKWFLLYNDRKELRVNTMFFVVVMKQK